MFLFMFKLQNFEIFCYCKDDLRLYALFYLLLNIHSGVIIHNCGQIYIVSSNGLSIILIIRTEIEILI